MLKDIEDNFDDSSQKENWEVYPPLVTPEEELAIKTLYDSNPILKNEPLNVAHPSWTSSSDAFHKDEPWIQTFSGKRFNPTKPVSSNMVIQDIAHALSMQCRFSGHIKKFYSVAQHSVLVSYICNEEDALWGLLHDASEAYLVDVPSPLKRSGKFDAYLEFEKDVQEAVCVRFGLPLKEPPTVKKADQMLLSTEARDLLVNIRNDWYQSVKPLPFKIIPLPPQKAEALFLNRFFELIGDENGYKDYLRSLEESSFEEDEYNW